MLLLFLCALCLIMMKLYAQNGRGNWPNKTGNFPKRNFKMQRWQISNALKERQKQLMRSFLIFTKTYCSNNNKNYSNNNKKNNNYRHYGDGIHDNMSSLYAKDSCKNENKTRQKPETSFEAATKNKESALWESARVTHSGRANRAHERATQQQLIWATQVRQQRALHLHAHCDKI